MADGTAMRCSQFKYILYLKLYLFSCAFNWGFDFGFRFDVRFFLSFLPTAVCPAMQTVVRVYSWRACMVRAHEITCVRVFSNLS